MKAKKKLRKATINKFIQGRKVKEENEEEEKEDKQKRKLEVGEKEKEAAILIPQLSQSSWVIRNDTPQRPT